MLKYFTGLLLLMLIAALRSIFRARRDVRIERDQTQEYFRAYLRWRDAALACEHALRANPYAADADELRDAALRAVVDARTHSQFLEDSASLGGSE